MTKFQEMMIYLKKATELNQQANNEGCLELRTVLYKESHLQMDKFDELAKQVKPIVSLLQKFLSEDEFENINSMLNNVRISNIIKSFSNFFFYK